MEKKDKVFICGAMVKADGKERHYMKVDSAIRTLVERIWVLEKALALQNHELVKQKIFIEQREFVEQAQELLLRQEQPIMTI